MTSCSLNVWRIGFKTTGLFQALVCVHVHFLSLFLLLFAVCTHWDMYLRLRVFVCAYSQSVWGFLEADADIFALKLPTFQASVYYLEI